MKETSAAIRQELKKAFPGIKFSVTTPYYSKVDVRWSCGPTAKQVEEITGKYEMGHFDGMTDSYDYSNRRDDIPQSRYVFLHREIPENLRAEIAESLSRYYGDWQTIAEYERSRRLSDKISGTDFREAAPKDLVN